METEDKLNLSQELESLKKHLDLAKDKLSYWTEVEFTQLTTVQADRHDSTVKSLLEEKQKLWAVLAEKKKESVQTGQMLDEKCQKLESLKTELEQLYSVSQQLHEAKAKHEAGLDQLSTQIQQTKQDLEAPTKAKEKLKYLAEASGVFENMVGLSFRKVKGNMVQVIFTHIDERDPLMPYYFFLQITGPDRQYKVSNPEPAVEGLEDMEKRLNETNNLRQFVIEMRRRFKGTIKRDGKT